jgi:6-phosphogluconolactonase
MSEWRTFTDREALDNSLAAHVVSKLALGIAARGTAYLVVSGGSTPVDLFSLLSASNLDWKNVVVLLADERCVPVDHQDRNERLVREVLLTGQAEQAQFLSLMPTPDDATVNIEGLSSFLSSLPRFDVVLLGMGEDGHTASLFPCASALKDGLTTDEAALITRPKTASHARVSMSRRRLQAADHGVIHITGEQKKTVLELASERDEEMRYPITAFLGSSGFDCWWAP